MPRKIAAAAAGLPLRLGPWHAGRHVEPEGRGCLPSRTYPRLGGAAGSRRVGRVGICGVDSEPLWLFTALSTQREVLLGPHLLHSVQRLDVQRGAVFRCHHAPVKRPGRAYQRCSCSCHR